MRQPPGRAREAIGVEIELSSTHPYFNIYHSSFTSLPCLSRRSPQGEDGSGAAATVYIPAIVAGNIDIASDFDCDGSRLQRFGWLLLAEKVHDNHQQNEADKYSDAPIAQSRPEVPE